jgi:LemA protein
MNNKRNRVYIIAGIVLIIIVYIIVTYNGLVKKQEDVNNKWNEVNNAYQRRSDLIPTLVNTVKGLANFEKNIFTDIAAARAKAKAAATDVVNANNITTQLAAQNELAAATNKLLITVESYPNLKGTTAFTSLQVQLEGTERRVKVARKDFNQVVADYNSNVKAFPAKIVASIFGFTPKEGFSAESGAEKIIEIKF